MLPTLLKEEIRKSHAHVENTLLWDTWEPKEYLNTYFAELGQDSIANFRFLIRELRRFKTWPKQRILDFGAGPTVFAGLVTAQYASEIHISDYIGSNLTEIRRWFDNDDRAFNWDNCIYEILKLEGISPVPDNIEARKQSLRDKPYRLLHCDASSLMPLGGISEQKYPLVIMNFCVDSATSSKEVWHEYMRNVLSIVEDNGTILISALRNCSEYKCGEQNFPSANINEDDLAESITHTGFHVHNALIEVCEVPECAPEGFTSLMFARATKAAPINARVRKYFIK